MVALDALALALVLSGAGETVLLEFSAAWCGPCRSVAPTVERLAAEGYPIRPVDVDREPQLARQYGVTGVPCFVLLVDGREADRLMGAASYDRLVQMLAAERIRPAAGNGPGADRSVRGPATPCIERIAGSAAPRRFERGPRGERRRPFGDA